jgi:hypothetical protein
MRRTNGRIADINVSEMGELARAKTVSQVFDILKESNKRQEKELVEEISKEVSK